MQHRQITTSRGPSKSLALAKSRWPERRWLKLLNTPSTFHLLEFRIARNEEVAKLDNKLVWGKRKSEALLLEDLELLANGGVWQETWARGIPTSVVLYNRAFLVQGIENGPESHARGIVHFPTDFEHGAVDERLHSVLDVDVCTCAGRIRQVHVRPRSRLEDAHVEDCGVAAAGAGDFRVGEMSKSYVVCSRQALLWQLQQGIQACDRSGLPIRQLWS